MQDFHALEDQQQKNAPNLIGLVPGSKFPNQRPLIVLFQSILARVFIVLSIYLLQQEKISKIGKKHQINKK